jgi:hypothetical protein
VANSSGGKYQSLLAAFQLRQKPISKRALAKAKRIDDALWEQFARTHPGPKQQGGGLTKTVDSAPKRIEPATAAEQPEATYAAAKPPTVPQILMAECEYVSRRAPGSITEGLAEFLYENQARLWPHLKGEIIPRPEWYRSKPVEPIPEGSWGYRAKKVERSSDLTGDHAIKLYDSVAFAMRQHGAIMSAHVVILWESFGVHDHEIATRLLSEHLNQAKKWTAVGKCGEPRRRRRERTGEGFDFRLVYVHENAKQRGFHTHILCTVPRYAAKAFEAWSGKTLGRLARHDCFGRSVRVVSPRASNEDAAIVRGWNWFRYICKQLRQGYGLGPVDEPPTSLRTILKVWPYRVAQPVTCAQLVGGSQDIWTKAQKEAGYVSRLRHDNLDSIYDGNEMAEWRCRQRLAEFGPLNLG